MLPECHLSSIVLLFFYKRAALGILAAAGVRAAHIDTIRCAETVFVVLAVLCFAFNFAVVAGAVRRRAVHAALFVFIGIAVAYRFAGRACVCAVHADTAQTAAALAVVVAVIYVA